MTNVLVLTGGSPHAHDFDSIGSALDDLLRAHGFVVERSDHPDTAATSLDRGGVDVLVVDGLWWQMLDDRYEPWRDHAYVTPASTKRSIERFVDAGGGLVALHTTTICFDDWADWGDIVGGSWHWGVSSHPPLGPVSATITGDHPVVAGLPHTIELIDEIYGDLTVSPDIEVLAVARRTSDDDEQPVVWAHRFGSGRVVFDGFGHDAAAIAHPQNSRLITQAVHWTSAGDGRASAPARTAP